MVIVAIAFWYFSPQWADNSDYPYYGHMVGGWGMPFGEKYQNAIATITNNPIKTPKKIPCFFIHLTHLDYIIPHNYEYKMNVKILLHFDTIMI